MRFGEFAVADALGVILARAVKSTPHPLGKGHRLGPDDIAALSAAGVTTVVGLRPDSGDLTEDQAALALATVAAGPGLECQPARGGCCDITAVESGLFLADAVALRTLHGTTEALMIATLPQEQAVEAGQRVARVKCIPFAASPAVIRTAGRAARGALRLAPFTARPTALVVANPPDTNTDEQARIVARLRDRLKRWGLPCTMELRVAHETASIADALVRASAAKVALIVVSGASSTADRGDTIPMAVCRAGGEIRRYGLPMEPGSLTLLARCGDAIIIDAPTCARSPAATSLDWLLARVAAGLAIDDDAIAGTGVGGLLR